MTKNYVADLQQSLRELMTMNSEREQLEKKIAKQKKRVAALYELVEADEDSFPMPDLVEGLTDACRVVLRAADFPLTPSQIRERVLALGLPPQANILASVHTTLKRMKDNNEIIEDAIPVGPASDRALAYKWNDEKVTLSALNPDSPEFKRKAQEYWRSKTTRPEQRKD